MNVRPFKKDIFKFFNYSSGSTSYSGIVGVDVSGCGIRDFNPLIASRISLIFPSIAVCFSVSEINYVFEILYRKQICYKITFNFMVKIKRSIIFFLNQNSRQLKGSAEIHKKRKAAFLLG